jgi:hypothetical protein
MAIDERVTNLENLVYALINRIDNDKHYTNADIKGTRQSVTEITPWTASKTAYIEDTEVVFSGVPTGNMTVFCKVPHTTEIDGDRVAVHFEPLEEVINITISVI